MPNFVGKVAIVTGASAGIGAAIAERLVADGMKVVGFARRVERVEELAKQLTGKPGKLYAVKADLTKESDILAGLKWVKDNLGPVHVLVNNAGLVKPATILTISTEDIKTIFDTNTIALTIMSREVCNEMIANKIDGHIININSIAGHAVMNFAMINVYSGSKFAVTALTETLRKEVTRIGSKIRVTSLSPGYVTTEILEPLAGKLTEDHKALINAPALAASDVAHSVAFVLDCPLNVNISELTIQPVGENF